MLADWASWNMSDELSAQYAGLAVKASACVECGDCEERCPFGVEVIAKMHKAAELFETQAA